MKVRCRAIFHNRLVVLKTGLARLLSRLFCGLGLVMASTVFGLGLISVSQCLGLAERSRRDL